MLEILEFKTIYSDNVYDFETDVNDAVRDGFQLLPDEYKPTVKVDDFRLAYVALMYLPKQTKQKSIGD